MHLLFVKIKETKRNQQQQPIYQQTKQNQTNPTSKPKTLKTNAKQQSKQNPKTAWVENYIISTSSSI